MGRSPKKKPAAGVSVTVIIPIAPGGNCELSLASIEKQDYDHRQIEILVAVGRHRSGQRNAALERAKGDIVWFMDNDVVIDDPTYLARMVAYYKAAETASVGGPSLTLPSNGLLQRAIGAVLGSYFATQSVRARYRPVGRLRRTNERELILCSQTFRRAFVHPKGFDERLHSGNEENELMNRLDRSGRLLIYDPDLRVYRSQRASLSEFVTQMAKYGKSRIEHFLIRPAAFEALFLVPLCFAAYLLLLPFALWLDPIGAGTLAYLSPLIAYGIAATLSAFLIGIRERSLSLGLVAAVLFPVVHLGYALGNMIGLFHRALTGGQAILPVDVHVLRPGAKGRRSWEAGAGGKT